MRVAGCQVCTTRLDARSPALVTALTSELLPSFEDAIADLDAVKRPGYRTHRILALGHLWSVMDFASHLSFVQVLVLFPPSVALHVAEEWPRFPRWARRFASAQYSDREYITTHVVALVLAIGAVEVVRWFPATTVLFGFLAIVFGPGVFCNAWFHIGGTVLSRTYCPGVITGVLVYLPLSLIVAVSGMREGLFTPRLMVAAFAVAAIFHTLEVGHNVFKRL